MAGVTSVAVVNAGIPVQIHIESPRIAKVMTSSIMTVSGGIRRICIKVLSTLDQAVQLQVIGDIFNPMSTPTEIGPILYLPVGTPIIHSTEIGLADDDWQPYIALQMTLLAAPTVGTVTAWAVGQG